MKQQIFYILAILIFISEITYAQTADNAELKKMYEEDQGARMSSKAIDWKVLNKQDSLRRVRVYQLIDKGDLLTGKDYYHSAMIFQHGNDTTASAMAVMQMKKAIALDPSVNKWLLAAAIDRDLMRKNKPQIYGTQFIKMGNNAKWERYKIDTTQITDQERKYYNVETLAEQAGKEWRMNLKPIAEQYKETNSIDNTIELIKEQHNKGRLSAFSLEEEVNIFGYELLKQSKDEEALKIFKLNTQLYPKGFNTFDSYGECLLKLGKKKEAMKAYKMSLKLNPQNDNAKKILRKE